MAEYNLERSNSVIDISLTELSFILFFILLVVAFWQLQESEELIEQQRLDIQSLNENIELVSEQFTINGISPEEVFHELKLAKAQAMKLSELELQLSALVPPEMTHETAQSYISAHKQIIDNIKEIGLDGEPDTILNELLVQIPELEQENNRLENLYEEMERENDRLESLYEELEQIAKDTKGQNANLREKVKQLGNGLDHPPCWADPTTGKIQYLYNVVIQEDSVVVHEGWPESREDQARQNDDILRAIGTYDSNANLWRSTNGIYKQSVADECRHYVRIFDHAESKASFKRYLLGVENHFYKYLNQRGYDG